MKILGPNDEPLRKVTFRATDADEEFLRKIAERFLEAADQVAESDGRNSFVFSISRSDDD